VTYRSRAFYTTLLSISLLAITVILLFVTAPKHEDFGWTDGASFALNGELIRDYVVSGFPHSPMTFAIEWFARYPALTISLYPPIFAMAEALVFALFGFSHPAAQATVAAFSALAAGGAYFTARTAMPPLAAVGAALLLFATPNVLLWSRQVVMELPALAFLLVGAAVLLRYQSAGGTWRLFLAVIFILAAVYTKQTALFVVPAFAIALLAQEGPSLLCRRPVWLAAATGVIGLLPLAVFTIMFAPLAIEAAFGQGTGSIENPGEASRISIAAFTVYARALPEIVGLPSLVGALGYLGLLTTRGWRGGAERRLVVLMLGWFAVDYVFISGTAHFEARYGTTLTIPPAILSALFVTRLAGPRLQSFAALAAGIALFSTAIATQKVPRITGYDAVAAYVVNNSEQDSVVLFQGNESKNLVFSIRSHSATPKVFILRAEKLLVNYTIIREWGITDRNLSTSDIEALIDNNRISTVILQPDFWTDQPSIARLQALVYSDRFQQVAEFPIASDVPSHRTTIKVFRKIRLVPSAERATRSGVQ
jgi:4-amino-4-deoxy-L-arabinose transferase-like glycosyltransferase